MKCDEAFEIATYQLPSLKVNWALQVEKHKHSVFTASKSITKRIQNLNPAKWIQFDHFTTATMIWA